MSLPAGTPLSERLAYYSVSIPSTGCRVWIGARDKDGYGLTSIKAKKYLAHKASYECSFGPVPDGMCVLHRCDNSKCIAPGHLFLGTRGENNVDRAAKGRSRDSHGEKHPLAKLTTADVRAIRLDKRSSAAIAVGYGVTASCIASVKSRRTWTHI